MTVTDERPDGAPPGDTARGRSLGLVAVLTASVFWSFGGTLGKATGAGGVVLSFWRMWTATLVMLVVCVVMRRLPSRADLRAAAPLGILFGLNICAFFISLEHLSVAIALIIGALTPVVALPVATIWMGERLTPVKVGCALAAVGGVVVAVIAAPSPSGDDPNEAIGYVWAVVSLLVWVAYLLLSKRVRDRVETVRFMFVMSLVGAVTVSVLVVATSADLGRVHGVGWLWMVLLAIGPGLMGHGLIAWAQPRVDSSVSTLLIQAEPVGASIAAWVFLGERVGLVQGLAMTAVLASLAYLALREAREARLVIDETLP
ncbi:MAG: DMT family transporter [Acidimicrobiales bacterium]